MGSSRRRCWAARCSCSTGVLLGCLAYKPQFGLLLPLALVATGRWRTIAAAAVTVLAVAGLTSIAFGPDVFTAFWHSLGMARRVVMEGAPGFHKIQSVYAGLRLIGVPMAVANAAQMLVALGCAVAIVMLWRSSAVFELKAAGIILASLIATPYFLDYDLVVLAPAIAFLAAHGLRQGFAPWEVSMLTALWVLPLAARSIAEMTLVSLTPIVLIAALGLVLRRAEVMVPAKARTEAAHRLLELAPQRLELVAGRGREVHRFAAAARARLVRVGEHELGRELVGLVVHLGAEEVHDGLGVDQHARAVPLDHLVIGLLLGRPVHCVFHPGAAALLDADSQAGAADALLGHDGLDARGCLVGQLHYLGAWSGRAHVCL